MLGTGLAQVIPFLATPVLTRLYSQEDFASYTSFFAIATILAVAAGGRYFLAIVLPRDREDALRLYGLSIYLTLFYALFLAVVFQVLYWSGINQAPEIIYYVPLYVLFYGIWISALNFSIREKKFLKNAISKLYQAGGYILTAIFIGLTTASLYGLVLAKTIGTLVSGVYLGRNLLNQRLSFPWKDLKKVALQYIDYPKYSIAPAFLNTLSAQALILFLTQFYSNADLGFYGLTYMVLSAPLGLIGTSYRDVFYQKITEQINEGLYRQALVFFRKSAVFLFAVGLIIALILFFLGPQLFGFVFGEDWIRSGEFAGILSFSFMVKLVASPMSSIFNAAHKIKAASLWQTLYFLSTFTTLFIGSYFLELQIVPLLYLYLVHEFILYTIYFVMEYRIALNLSRGKA